MKKDKIKSITNRDKELFKQLGRTAIITREQAQNYLGYDNNNKRLSNLTKDGYLKEEFTKVKNEYVSVYRLDDRGRDYIKNNISEIDKLYKFASVNHDYCLTELYYKEYWDFRDTWQTETDYKQDYSYGAPDATITICERTIIIEVVTSSYTKEQIESKETFAEQHNMEVRMYNA